MQPHQQIISIDWGTSSLRVKVVHVDDGHVSGQWLSDRGSKPLFEAWQLSGHDRIDFYMQALEPAWDGLGLHPHHELPVLISGMASSSIGIAPLPYATLPFGNDGTDLYVEQLRGASCPVACYLVSGVASADDVMRGEETQVVGVQTGMVGFGDHIFVLPGTHSKHVYCRQGKVVDFHTYMTGEIFEVMCHSSILRHSVRKESWQPGFRAALHAGARAGVQGALGRQLFKVRTRDLLQGATAEDNFYFLSGLLIAHELRDLPGRGSDIVLCAEPHLVRLYSEVAGQMGLELRVPDTHILQNAMALGHRAIYKGICEGTIGYMR